jgi:hypothetical protein
MRQRFAIVGEEKHNIAGLRLRLAQRQPQAHAVDGGGVLPALQDVSRPAPAELFLRSSLRRDLEIVTPSRISTSPMRRASVQLWRSATGASSNGVTTRSAASALTGAGPGAGLNATARKVAAGDCILANAKRLRNARADPARQRQQYRSRPIRLAAIARNR